MNKYEHLRVPSEKSKAEVVIPVDPDLRLREELLGPHAANAYVHHNSASRSYMYGSHQSQSVTLIDGDEPIIQTGVENQLARHTFGPKLDDDVRVMRVIKRYGSLNTGRYVSNVVEDVAIVLKEEYDENLQKAVKTLDIVNVEQSHSGFHQDFGFSYIRNEEVLKNLKPGTWLPKGTVLAQSPSIRENNGYALGVNANILLSTLPDVAEDSVVISKSLAKKLAYDVFEKVSIEFGSDYLPLNLYGNDTEYKPFPEIGETVGKDSVLMALRNFKDFGSSKTATEEDPKDFTPGLLSNRDLQTFDPNFDKCYYVRGPGEEIKDGDNVKKNGVIIDIVCYKNPRKNSELYYGMADLPDKYARSYIKFTEDVINAYHDVCKELNDKDYVKNGVTIHKTPKLHNFIVNCGKIAVDGMISAIKENSVLSELAKNIKIAKGNKSPVLPNKLGLSNRKDVLDTYRVEFIVKYRVIPTKGHKISDQSGGKGVISDVRDDELMPHNNYARADIIMDTNSVINRMNLARIYQQHVCATSRYCQQVLRQMANGLPIEQLDENKIEEMFTYLMGLLGIFDTPQFDRYAVATLEEKMMILDECVNKEVYIMSQVTNKKTSYQVVKDIDNSVYRPPRDNVVIPYKDLNGEIKSAVTKDKMFIAPLYIILLSKTSDNMLFTSSSNFNNFLFPIAVTAGNRDRLPNRNTPTKIMSETEGRLYAYYGGREFAAEMKDRANSIPTHMDMYNNILSADEPLNTETLVDRGVTKFGNDSAIRLVHAILKPLGMDFVYVKGSK